MLAAALLIAGALIYFTGVIRSDAEIVGDVETRFNLDSGLQGKALAVQSASHVVTIGGSVDYAGQHTAAVREASSVRGVRQLVDQVHIVAPVPTKPKIMAAPAVPPPTAITATLAIIKAAGNSQVRAPNSVHAAHIGKPALAAPVTQSPKRGGLFHLFRKNKDKNVTPKNGSGH